eukprot:7222008-Pyramimonas_sp.AAC.1
MRPHGHPRPRGLVRGPAGACFATVFRLVWSTQSLATVTCRTEVQIGTARMHAARGMSCAGVLVTGTYGREEQTRSQVSNPSGPEEPPKAL